MHCLKSIAAARDSTSAPPVGNAHSQKYRGFVCFMCSSSEVSLLSVSFLGRGTRNIMTHLGIIQAVVAVTRAARFLLYPPFDGRSACCSCHSNTPGLIINDPWTTPRSSGSSQNKSSLRTANTPTKTGSPHIYQPQQFRPWNKHCCTFDAHNFRD